MVSSLFPRTSIFEKSLEMGSSSDYANAASHRFGSFERGLHQETDTFPFAYVQSVGLINPEWERPEPADQSMNSLLDVGTSASIVLGQLSFQYPAGRILDLVKLERQHRERLAGVWLNPIAQKLLNALDRETSIRWEDIPDKAECDWSEAAKAAALLAGANLCEVSPTRIRLSEYGDKLLADMAEQASHEVAI